MTSKPFGVPTANEGGELENPGNGPAWAMHAFDEIASLHKFVNSAQLGVGFTAHLPELLKLMPEVLNALPPEGSDEYTYAALAQWADAEAGRGSPYIFGLGAVRLVTVLETLIGEICVELISRHPETLDLEVFQRLKGPLLEFARASESERIEYLLDLLTQETRARLKPGVGRFEPILNAVGLGGAVDDRARRRLLELLEMRNIIIHRNSRADRRLLARCPWLGTAPSSVVQVDSQMFTRYATAVRYYALELLRRWSIVVDGYKEDAELVRMRDSLAMELAEELPADSA